MIFLVVGTQRFQFNRLLKKVDQLIESGIIKEKVFAQIGHSNYIPLNFQYTDFLSKEEFDSNVRNCDLLITHAGVSTIISGISQKKPTIVIPRLEKHKEHVDNHQLEISQAFQKKKFILYSENEQELDKLIKKSKNYNFSMYYSQTHLTVDLINEFLKIEKH